MLKRLTTRLLAIANGREIAMAEVTTHGAGARAVVEAALAEAEEGTPLHAALVCALAELDELERLMARTDGRIPSKR